MKDLAQVGGKNASLGEMIRELTSKGVRIPDGYAVTAAAYRYLLESAGITSQIQKILSDLDTHDMKNLSERGKKIRSLIYNAELPKDLGLKLSPLIKNSAKNTERKQTSRSGVRPQRKTFPMPALPGSRRLS